MIASILTYQHEYNAVTGDIMSFANLTRNFRAILIFLIRLLGILANSCLCGRCPLESATKVAVISSGNDYRHIVLLRSSG
jgi:hypothetical protein